MKKRIWIMVVGLGVAGTVFLPVPHTNPRLLAQDTNTDEQDAATRIAKIANGINPVEMGKGEEPVALGIEKLMQLYNY